MTDKERFWAMIEEITPILLTAYKRTPWQQFWFEVAWCIDCLQWGRRIA
jgi:hypothetical protein